MVSVSYTHLDVYKRQGLHMVLLVVDTQKGIVEERLYAFEKFVSNIKELIRTAREPLILLLNIIAKQVARKWKIQ